ncbi:hypothetical protein Bca4012_083678 [Brassica carinata]
MAAYVSVGNIHDLYLSGQVYRGKVSWSSGFTFKENSFKDLSWSSGVSKALNAERCGCHHSRGVSSFTESLKLRIRAASSSSTKYYDFTVIGSRVAVSARETSVAYHTLQLDPVERRRKKKRGRKSSRQINYGC